MVHVGGYYKKGSKNKLGGSYGCFTFISTEQTGTKSQMESWRKNEGYKKTQTTNSEYNKFVSKVVETRGTGNLNILVIKRNNVENLGFLKINRLYYYIVIVLLVSCSKTYNLSDIDYINNKKTIINDKNLKSSSLYKFKSKNYPLETDIYYNKKGEVERYGKSKGEGMLFYYNSPDSAQLPLEIEYRKNIVKLDKLNNWIIDNNDTIEKFKKSSTGIFLYFKNTNNNRINLYFFK